MRCATPKSSRKTRTSDPLRGAATVITSARFSPPRYRQALATARNIPVGHEGEYRDVEPTRHTVEWTGMAMYRVEDGQIAEI